VPDSLAVTESETRTIQKIRARILPIAFVLYVVAFIDRINIGFAALTMNSELGITRTRWVDRNDTGLPLFGSQPGAAIPCGGSRPRRWDRVAFVTRCRFSDLNDPIFGSSK
jgi:hypothetical protein